MTTKSLVDGRVILYPYRTAEVTEIFLTVPRSLLKDLENELAKKVDKHRDNHTVYKITQDRSTVYVWFYDNQVSFGHGIKMRPRE